MAIPALVSAIAGMVGSSVGNKIGQSKNPTIADRMKQMNTSQTGGQNMPQTFGDWSGKTGGPVGIANYNTEQQGMQKEIGQMGMEGLRDNNFDFGPIKDATMQDFYQNFLPHMQSRFTGMEGDQRSSGYMNMIGGAGKGLEAQLAAMQQQYGQSEQQNYQKQVEFGNKPQWDMKFRERQPGIAESLATGFGPAALTVAGTMGAAALTGKYNKEAAAIANPRPNTLEQTMGQPIYQPTFLRK
jgi:hypothetical protein